MGIYTLILKIIDFFTPIIWIILIFVEDLQYN
jgi:hypothetical protein